MKVFTNNQGGKANVASVAPYFVKIIPFYLNNFIGRN